jgi:hypothetical protein
MNQPIPTQSMKSPDASTRQEGQGFFMPVIPSGLGSPSFDSFISRENREDPRAKELEEEEKEKKRKKAEQAAAALAAPQQATTPTGKLDDVSLNPSSREPQTPNHSPTNSGSTKTETQSKASENQNSNAIQTPDSNQPAEDSALDSASEEDLPPGQYTANGTDHATDSDDMFSIAQMDAQEAGQPIVGLKQASITTSGRLNTFTAAERIATTPVSSGSSTGSNPESNLSQSGNNAPTPSTATRAAATQKPNETSATSMLRSLGVEIEKFTQSNRSQLQLELPVSESESVKVRLSMRGSELHTVFVTESVELREALKKAWPEFSQTSRDKGFRFNDPAFQQSANQQGTPSGDREARKRAQTNEPSLSIKPIAKPKKSNLAQNSSGSVSLWA